MDKLNEQHRCQAQGNANVQNVQLVDNRWENPQLSAAAGQSTMALTPMLVAVEQQSLTDNRWVRSQLTAAAGQSTMALTPMLVAGEQQSYGTSGQTNWTAGVSPMMKKVSVCVSSRGSTRIHPPTQAGKAVSHGWVLMSRTHQQPYGVSGQPNWPAGVPPMIKNVSLYVMSRWSTRIHPPANAWKEVSCRWVLMLRTHHPNEEDNPSSGYSERVVEDYTAHLSGQRATASSVRIGKYIYAVILICGLVLHDQCEQHRKARRYDSGRGVSRMVYLIIRFFGEWMQLENLKLIGILMGVATIVPTAISSIEFTRQSMWRTLVLGTFVCKWIQGQINTKSYQGLQSCLVCVQSLTMNRWITRSASQGASQRREPGI